ncbi:NADH-quinone oxidoreductase subunit C [Bacillus kwashiorkori]|uniref:NADH-quinone oxidoreductase subunit C n=1 Tax=Bacillus kwashiorkori TaxID=1522318 RepID=UPI0007866718|nr:NADH-quinone oxidoreductase subunit C [Bacillus kwashiorkori]
MAVNEVEELTQKIEKYVSIIESEIGEGVIEKWEVNKMAKHLPTLEVSRNYFYQVAEVLKTHEETNFNYLLELHGTDFESYLEVYVCLYSMKNREKLVLKTKLEIENPVIDSLTPLWPGADWPECEAFDLLGITFTGHPNLQRIFLGDDWKGYPLRKDYKDENEWDS